MTLPTTRQKFIDDFRANAGQVGGEFANSRVILLTTTDRSGGTRTVPLTYFPDEGERLLVVASAAGAAEDPDWYADLLADPEVTVETGVFTMRANAVPLDPDARAVAFARVAEADPRWSEYQSRTDRVIPVIALDATGGGPNPGRLGDGLRMVHGAFRRELAIVRAELARSGPRVGAQLRINCLAACQGLQHHHLIEDAHIFPSLLTAHPELAAAIDRLVAEHHVIADLVERLQARITAATAGGADANGGSEASSDLLSDVDQLIAELTAHLDYEEDQLVEILNGTPAPR